MTLLRFRSGPARASPRRSVYQRFLKPFVFPFVLLRRLLPFKFFLFVVHPLFSILYFLHQTPSYSQEHLASLDTFLGCSPADLLHFLSSSLLILSNNVVLSFFSLSLDFGRCLVACLRLLLVWANFLWPYCRPVLLHLWQLYLDLPRIYQATVAGLVFSALLLLFLHLNGTLSRGAAALRRTGRRISRTYTRVTAFVAASAPFVLACLFYFGLLLILGPRRREQLHTLQHLLWYPLAIVGTASCFWRFVYLPRLHPVLLFCKTQAPVPGAQGAEQPSKQLAGVWDTGRSSASSAAARASAPQQADGTKQPARDRKQGEAVTNLHPKGTQQKGRASSHAAVSRENSWVPFQRWTSWRWSSSEISSSVEQTPCDQEDAGVPGATVAGESPRVGRDAGPATVSGLANAKAIAAETRNAWMRITFWLEVWVFMTTCNFVAWLPLVNRFAPLGDCLVHHVLSLFFILTVISGGPTQATIHQAAFRLIRGLAALLSAVSSQLFGVALVLPSHGAADAKGQGGPGIFYFPDATPTAVSSPSSLPENSVRRGVRQVFSFFLPFVSASSLSFTDPDPQASPTPSPPARAFSSPLVASTRTYAANAICQALGFSSESWLSGLLSLLLHLPQVLLVLLPEFLLTPALAYLRAGRPLFGAVVSLSAPGPSALPERLYWLLYFLASSGVSILYVSLREHNLLRYMPFQSSFLLLAIVAMQTAVKFFAKGAEVRVRVPEKRESLCAPSPRAAHPASPVSQEPETAPGGGRGGAVSQVGTEERGWDCGAQASAAGRSTLFPFFRRRSPTSADKSVRGTGGDVDSGEASVAAAPVAGRRESRRQSVQTSPEGRTEREDRDRSARRESPASDGLPPSREAASAGKPDVGDGLEDGERGDGKPDERNSSRERGASQAPSERNSTTLGEPARRWADEEVSSEDDGLGAGTQTCFRGSEAARRFRGLPKQAGPADRAGKAVWRPRSGEACTKNVREERNGRSRQGRPDAPCLEKGSVGTQVEGREPQFGKRGGKTVGNRSKDSTFRGDGSPSEALETQNATERRGARPGTPASQGERESVRGLEQRRHEVLDKRQAASQKGRSDSAFGRGPREDALHEWNLVDDDLSDE